MEKLLERLRSRGTWRLEMGHGEALTVDRPMELQVSGGRAWITVEGEPDDWFLADGQRFTTPAGRQTVIQADSACSLMISAASLQASATPPAKRLGDVMSRLRASALHRLPASFAADLAGNLRSGLALLRA